MRADVARVVANGQSLALPGDSCDKFAARFGEDARAITAAARFKDWRLRGIHARVLEAGDVGPGDAIVVLRRPRPREGQTVRDEAHKE